MLQLLNIEQQAISQRSETAKVAQTTKPAQTAQKIIAVDTLDKSTSHHIVVQKPADLSEHKVAGEITRAAVAFKNKTKQHRSLSLKQPIHKPVQFAKTNEQLSDSVIKKSYIHNVYTKHSNSQSDAVDLNKTLIAVRKHLESYKFYPASARRRGIEGHVDVGFELIPDGVANQVSVLHSSGYTVLDHAALEAVYRAQPFPIGDGKYRFRLTFKRL